ncbi:citrate synthase-lysine N-methyltransferase CSKMT, mitochondrial [Rhinatrema bivittatum]|uniref:citrate synthase-lysine N-methyltransferase CSKMT, mitochondrial n=1 Tax=Rhinatrema bivittatum TaxID=194408 RepID=UPI00112E350C|nr:citrate synthase-lysine N-methyltransferase CSKMT, mitochondrial [Rhinatrema bivittatum]
MITDNVGSPPQRVGPDFRGRCFAVNVKVKADDLRQRLHCRSTWDHFYKEKTADGFCHFDWFFGYKHVSGFLLSFSGGARAKEPWWVLDVGCGTSDLGPGLYRDSLDPINMFCLDFSRVAIDCMQGQIMDGPPPRNPLSQLHFMEADATDLCAFNAQTFHLVLDKGTCDSLLRGPAGFKNTHRMLAECMRVLRPGGTLLQLSDEDPDARLLFLEQASKTHVTVQELGHVHGVCYYGYIITLPAC